MIRIELMLAVEDYIFDNFATIMKGKKVRGADNDINFINGILDLMPNSLLRDLIRYFKWDASYDDRRVQLMQTVHAIIKYEINKPAMPQQSPAPQPQPQPDKKKITIDEAIASVKNAPTKEAITSALEELKDGQIIGLFNVMLKPKHLDISCPRDEAIKLFIHYELIRRNEEAIHALNLEERIQKLATLDNETCEHYLRHYCNDEELEDIAKSLRLYNELCKK